MSIKPKNHFKTKIVRKVKDITIGSTLSLLLISASLQSCGSEDEYQEGIITEGVRTHIQEVDVRIFNSKHTSLSMEMYALNIRIL